MEAEPLTAGESVTRGSRRSLDTAEIFNIEKKEWQSAGKMPTLRTAGLIVPS